MIPIGLGIGWPPELFNETDGLCVASLPAKKQPKGYAAALSRAEAWAGGTPALLAQRAADYNLIIGKALAKANDIFVSYRLSEQPVTAEAFIQDYNTEYSKNYFVQYMRQKMKEQHRRGKIADNTRKVHNSTLNALAEFRASIPFYSLSPEFADDFHQFLKKKKLGANTIWCRHKHVKTYLLLAKKDRIKFDDPYVHFKNKTAKSSWRPLPPAELSLLEGYYQLQKPASPHRRVLQRFLFSCFSSLRLSDLKNIDHATFNGLEMTFRIQKTYEKKMREMMLPITRRAMRYLEDSRAENGVPGFFNYSDQYSNRELKNVAKLLGLTTKLHHHVGRETFATEFIRRGGKVEVLQKLLDHEKIQTTMRYVHVDDEMKRAAIQMLDEQDDAPPLMKVS